MAYSSRGERISVGVKAHVLFSRLLSIDDYWSLLGSDNVGEVAQKLRLTAYADSMSTLPPDPHRHDVQTAIKTALLDEAAKFMTHLSSPRDRFFKSWISWYEAEDLKSIFRHLAAGCPDREKLRQRLAVRANGPFYENLISARNYDELLSALSGSTYCKILLDSLKRLSTGEERSLFPLEMALDSFVELSLFKAMKKLEPAERDSLLPIFGSRMDLYNLYILYRALAFYKMTPEETLNRLLPVRYRVSLQFLREAVRADSMEHVADMLAGRFPVYAELIVGALHAGEPQLTLERNINRYIYMQAHRVFGSGSPDFHTAIGYFVLKEYEIGDIVRIIESVRYGYDRRIAADNLVRPIVAGGDA